jgi:hypothetical protein
VSKLQWQSARYKTDFGWQDRKYGTFDKEITDI